MSIDYLLIGNIVQDVTPDGLILGGTALYSAATAQRLGRQVGLVTRLPEGLVAEVELALPGVEILMLPADQGSIFENRYDADERVQFLHSVAPPIDMAVIPDEWRRAPVVHLGPLTAEIPPSVAAQFAGVRVCATPQGWLRGRDEAGRVYYVPLDDPVGALAGIDALVFSTEDVGHEPAAVEALIRAVPLAVITRAAGGAVVHDNQRGERRQFAARPAQVVDPTGAGDVFAAAFFARLDEGGDPYRAAAYANAVASFSIEARGIEGIPTREQIEEWMAAHPTGDGRST